MKKLLLAATAVTMVASSFSFALDAMMMQNSNMDMSDGKMMKGEMMTSGEYKDYWAGNITSTIRSGKTAVIFFYSDDSDTAVKLDADIKANWKSIPSNVVIIKARVDKEANLRKLYNVKLKGGVIVVSPKGKILARK